MTLRIETIIYQPGNLNIASGGSVITTDHIVHNDPACSSGCFESSSICDGFSGYIDSRFGIILKIRQFWVKYFTGRSCEQEGFLEELQSSNAFRMICQGKIERNVIT